MCRHWSSGRFLGPRSRAPLLQYPVRSFPNSPLWLHFSGHWLTGTTAGDVAMISAARPMSPSAASEVGAHREQTVCSIRGVVRWWCQSIASKWAAGCIAPVYVPGGANKTLYHGARSQTLEYLTDWSMQNNRRPPSWTQDPGGRKNLQQALAKQWSESPCVLQCFLFARQTHSAPDSG